ncbi:MAG: hypothetical protein LRY51_14335 [Geovibrio sp.]|nr:hypothetical protein [Geovibrio sp.]
MNSILTQLVRESVSAEPDAEHYDFLHKFISTNKLGEFGYFYIMDSAETFFIISIRKWLVNL